MNKSDMELYRLLGISPPVDEQGISVMMPYRAMNIDQQNPLAKNESLEPSIAVTKQPSVRNEQQSAPQPYRQPQQALPQQIPAAQTGHGGGFMPASFTDKRMMISDNLIEQDGDAYRDLVKKQQDAITGRLANRDTFSFTDLSPAMALVDQLTGSKMAQSYRGPASADQDVATINSLGKQLADFDNKKRQTDVALLNALKEKGSANPFDLEELKHKNRLSLAQFKASNNPSATQPKQSEAQKVVDREFAKEYQKFVLSGGYGDANKGLEQLKEVSSALKTNKNLTGPLIGMTPDSALKMVNPKALSVRETIEEVVQRNLREVLGAQFTEKEGERLIARAYNPSLPAAENAKRVDRLIKQVQTVIEAKTKAARHYEQYGSMGNYKPVSLRTAEDVENFIADGDSSTPPQASTSPTNKQSSIQQELARRGLKK
jgi:hypothetical protein